MSKYKIHNNYNSRTILLTQADYIPTLEAARQLGKAGLNIIVADSKRFRLANWSKYVSYVKSPDLKDTEKFLSWLKKNAKLGRFNILLPTSDIITWYVSSRSKELSKYFDTFIPSQKAIRASLFKNILHDYCQKYNIPTPITYFPKSYRDVQKFAKIVKYPAIVKHITTVGIKWEKKGEVFYSQEELIKNYKKDSIVYDKQLLLKKNPYMEWPMIQEYIPETHDNFYNAHGISIDNGQYVSIICAKKIRHMPPKVGIAICVEPVFKLEIVNEIKKFLRAIGYCGTFGAELIYDKRDGKYKLIDFNPRMMGSVGVATANGLNLPLLWYNCLCGNANIENRIFNGNRIFIHVLSDILYLPGNFIHSNNKIKAIYDILRTYLKPKKFAVFSIEDPAPALIDLIMTVRNKVKHPLFYLRELLKGE